MLLEAAPIGRIGAYESGGHSTLVGALKSTTRCSLSYCLDKVSEKTIALIFRPIGRRITYEYGFTVLDLSRDAASARSNTGRGVVAPVVRSPLRFNPA